MTESFRVTASARMNQRVEGQAGRVCLTAKNARERAYESKGRGSSWPGLFYRKERKEHKDTGVMTGDELESL